MYLIPLFFDHTFYMFGNRIYMHAPYSTETPGLLNKFVNEYIYTSWVMDFPLTIWSLPWEFEHVVIEVTLNLKINMSFTKSWIFNRCALIINLLHRVRWSSRKTGFKPVFNWPNVSFAAALSSATVSFALRFRRTFVDYSFFEGDTRPTVPITYRTVFKRLVIQELCFLRWGNIFKELRK